MSRLILVSLTVSGFNSCFLSLVFWSPVCKVYEKIEVSVKWLSLEPWLILVSLCWFLVSVRVFSAIRDVT